MSWAAWTGWAIAVSSPVCAAVGLWHHRRGAARVARCTHELRGPLGALRLGLDLALARGGLSGDRLCALDLQVARATAALAELDGRPAPPVRRQVPVADLLAETVASLNPMAADRGADLRLAGATDAVVVGDRGRLAQALGNLVANAVEHGGPSISVGGRVGEGVVRLEVRDDGPGLSVSGRRQSWRRSLRRPRVRRHGHGLSVVAEVAAAHGGRLLSVPAETGARIILELPLDSRGAPAPALPS